MIKINIHFFNIINIALMAVIIDILMYFFKSTYMIAFIVGIISILNVNAILIYKKIIKVKSDFQMLDLVFFIFLGTFMFLKISIPDFSYDVANYHIYLQDNVIIDKINFDFFAGKAINGFLFGLGDRMYYISRSLLGYRLGTILSYYSICIMYYQIKNILKLVDEKNAIIPIVSALVCFSSVIAIQVYGLYYIDMFSLVFTLEIIYQILDSKNIFNNPKLMCYFSVILGVVTAIKITNLILMIPIILFMIVLHKNEINKKFLKWIPLYIFLIFIPLAKYVIDNIIQTGSPIFPYYNTFFKSKFFAQYNWKEGRFGIDSWLKALIWPIYVSVVIQGYGDDCQTTDPIWAIGFIAMIGTLIYCILKKKTKTIAGKISILSMLVTIIWIVMLEGYMRYALIIPIMYGILISILFLKIYKVKVLNKKIKYGFMVSAVFISIYIICMAITVRTTNNYKYVFKDREGYKIDIDGVWGVLDDDSALTELVRNKDVPIYNLSTEFTSETEFTNNLYEQKVLNKKIYVLTNEERKERKISWLKQNGFEIKFIEVYTVEQIPYISFDETIYLYEVEYQKR